MKRFTAKRNNRAGWKLYTMIRHLSTYEQKSDLSPKHYRHRGIALAWTAIVITVILLLVGLSLDTAKLAINIHQMQNAVDAASLAGAQIVKISSPDDIRLFTHDLAFANKAEQLEVFLRKDPPYVQNEPFTGDEYSFDILIGRWVRYNRTFIPTLDAPNAVQAIAHRNASMGAVGPAIKYIFGPLAGVPDANASTLAIAWSYNSGGAGLICLSDPVPGGDPGLQIGGNADIDIDGGGIHVNSTASGGNSTDSTWVQLGAKIDAGFLNVVGGVDPPPDDGNWQDIFDNAGSVGYSVCDESTIPNPEHIEDPLAANMVGDPLVAPNSDGVYSRLMVPEMIESNEIPTVTQTLEGTPITGTITTSCSLGPGYYPYGLQISNGVDVTLVPTASTGLGTIFVFGGGTGQPNSLGSGITMTGGSLTAHGATCYVTYNFSTNVCGIVDITGGALDLYSPGDWENEINPPATEEIYLSRVSGRNGVAIWQDPTMVDSKGDAPDAHLRGNGDFSIKGTVYFPDPIHVRLEGDLGNTGNQILCGSAKIEGTAIITVAYDNRNQGLASSVCLVK